MIGLGVLAAQAVIVPIASAMLEDRAPTPVEVTAPPLPAAPEAEPATDVDAGAGDGGVVVRVSALVG
jgi:hypothetical protein